MSPENRREARVVALQALCQYDVQGDDFDAQLDEFLRDAEVDEGHFSAHRRPYEVVEFARSLARGCWAGRAAYDERLKRSAVRWNVERMAFVDRNVLRLAIHELLERPDTPRAVVINEAVELARVFGEADSPAFVNGVLEGIWKQIEEETGRGELAGAGQAAE